MKQTSLIALTALASLTTQAQTILDQWTFTNVVGVDAGPQYSDIKDNDINFWDPALAGNSHDAGAGVLTWGHLPSGGQYTTSSTAWLGNDVGVAGVSDQLIMTIDAKDINFTANSFYRWQITEGVGGNVRGLIQYTAINGNVTMRIEGLGSEVNMGTLYKQADYTSITDLQLTYTWDITNQTMSAEATGSGVLAAGGTGTISLSNTVAATELSALSSINAFRTGGQGAAGSYIELDAVTISTAAVPEPSTLALMGGLTALGFVLLRRRRA